MSQTVFGAEAVVTFLNRAFNNTAPGNLIFQNQVAAAGTSATSQTAFASQFGQSFSSLTDADLANQVLGNMGVLPNADLVTALTDYFAAVGTDARGIVVLQLGQILANLEGATGDLAIFAAAATAWNNEVTKSFEYSINPANTATADPLNPPDTTAPVVTAATFSYAENQVADAVVADVDAADAVGVTSFEIKSGNADGYFAIGADGKITITAAGVAAHVNNFESGINTASLVVVAKDAAGNTSAETTIVLNETNVGEFTTGAAAGTTVKLNFDGALKSGITVPVADFAVTQGSSSYAVTKAEVSGTTVTLTLASTVAATGDVSIDYTGTALVDANNVVVAKQVMKAVPGDITPPTATISPVDGATAVATNANIVLTFNEAVTKGAGNITLTNAADATQVVTIDVASSQVTLSADGKTVTVDPAADLASNVKYNVSVPTGSFKDVAGNNYAGSVDYDFTTTTAAVPGQTFTLTTSVDNLTGTTGDDTFTGGTAEMQAADVINGGAGVNDTAKLFLDAGDDGFTASGVEIFQLQASGAPRIFTATNVTGATEVWSNKSSAALTVADLQNNVTLGLLETNSALNASFKAGVIGATGTLNVATSTSGTKAAPVAITVNDGGAADKFTTLAITAAAGDSYVTIDTVGTAANATLDLTTINTKGAGFVSVTSADSGAVGSQPFANVTTVDMQATAGSKVDLAASANAKDVKVTGGAGADNIVFAAAQFNTKDTVALGEGKDTLTLGDANLNAGATNDLTKAINAATGVDVLATTAVGTGGVAINAGLYTTINEFAVLGAAGTAAANSITGTAATVGTANTSTAGVTFSGVASDATDTLVITEQRVTGGAGAGTNSTAGVQSDASAGILISAKLDSGTDGVNLTIGDTTGAVIITGGAGSNGSGDYDAKNGNALDARQFETLNLTVGNDVTFDAGTAGSVANVADILLGANAKLTITGKGNVDLGTVAADANQAQFQNLTIDATTLDGTLIVVTGAGNDVIKAGSKAATITAGTGQDQITLGAGQDVVKFNVGDSGATVTATSISGIDVITGFKAGLGGDQLDEIVGARAYDALTANQQTTVTNTADLKAATDAALAVTNNNEWTAFTFGGKTYAVYNDTTTATYVATEDILVELVGVTVADLVSANFA